MTYKHCSWEHHQKDKDHDMYVGHADPIPFLFSLSLTDYHLF